MTTTVTYTCDGCGATETNARIVAAEWSDFWPPDTWEDEESSLDFCENCTETIGAGIAALPRRGT